MKCAYKIGLTGIDVATISLQVTKENVEEILPVLRERKHDGDERIKNLSDTNGVVVIGSHRFVCGFENKGHTPYANIEIHSALQDGNNLTNMQIKDLLEKYDMVAGLLAREYGILLAQEQKETARFSRLELNITFVTEYSFLTYFRFFKLLSYVILKKGGTVNLTGTVDNLRKAYEYETIKCDRSTYGIRIYNKGREISKKLNCLTPTANLLRVEFLYKKTQTIKTDFGDISIVQYTDEMIKRAFLFRFARYMDKVNAYIHEKLLLAPDCIGSCDTVPNIIQRHCNNGIITDHAAILGEFSYYENYYGMPLLFDVKDLKCAVKRLYDNKILTTGYTLEQHIHSFDYAIHNLEYGQSALVNQYTYAEEILYKMYHPCECEVVLDR